MFVIRERLYAHPVYGGCILYRKHVKGALHEEQHKFRRWHSFSYPEGCHWQNILCVTQEVLVKYSIKLFQNGADIHVTVIWTVFVFINTQNLLLSYVLQSWTSWYNCMVELITPNATNTYGGLLWRNICLLRVTYRVIQNDCQGFNNLSYTIHLR